MALTAAGHGPSAAQIGVLNGQLAGLAPDLQPDAPRRVIPAPSDLAGFSALHVAVRSARQEVTTLLLDAAARTDSKAGPAAPRTGISEALLRARDAHGRTALHVAASAHGGQVRAQETTRRKSLQSLALYRKKPRALQNLERVLDACTSLCACGMTPPPTAGVAPQPALLEALVQACDRHRRTALHHAAFAGSADAVARLCKVLQSQRLSVDRADHCGWTALHLACAVGHGDAAEALIGASASASKQDVLGWTPLHYAAMVRLPHWRRR